MNTGWNAYAGLRSRRVARTVEEVTFGSEDSQPVRERVSHVALYIEMLEEAWLRSG